MYFMIANGDGYGECHRLNLAYYLDSGDGHGGEYLRLHSIAARRQ